jgi:hypothetical protein
MLFLLSSVGGHISWRGSVGGGRSVGLVLGFQCGELLVESDLHFCHQSLVVVSEMCYARPCRANWTC